MRELNVYHHELRLGEYDEFYLKYEADKVISDKDAEIEKLKESIGKLLKSKTEQIMDEVLEKVVVYGEGFVPVEHAMKLVAELRHHKRKRCLAMWLYLRECYWRCKHHNEQTRANWYNKWMDVFQKLAEQFKEA